MSVDRERALAAAAVRFDEHLALVRRFVRQPSISGTGEGIAEMVALVGEALRGLGARVEVVPTAGWPVVFGALDAGQPRTLLVYGMYDVQPVEGETWRVPPFAGEVIDLPGLGASLVARGAYNSKGPLAGALAAIASIQAAGVPLPCNFKFVIEGEEELASRNLPAFVAAHRDRLAADAALLPFYTQNRRGTPVIKLGNKGVLFFDLVARGGDWGGPGDTAIHGAEGAWIASPAWRLVHVLGTLVDADERICVPRLLDERRAPSDEDEALIAALAARFDPAVVLEQQRARRFKHEGGAAALLRHFMFDPIINIDGIVSGHTGDGTKALLPEVATAKCNLRLVSDMTLTACRAALEAHVAAVGGGAIELRFGAGYPCQKLRAGHPFAQAFLAAVRACGLDPEVWPCGAGSAPGFVFSEVLGLPFLIAGLGHGGRQHAPDEYATVAGMRLMEEAMIRFFYELAAA